MYYIASFIAIAIGMIMVVGFAIFSVRFWIEWRDTRQDRELEREEKLLRRIRKATQTREEWLEEQGLED